MCRNKEGGSFNHVVSAGLIEKALLNKDVRQRKECPHRCQRKFSGQRNLLCKCTREESVCVHEPGGRCSWRNEELRFDPMFHQII